MGSLKKYHQELEALLQKINMDIDKKYQKAMSDSNIDYLSTQLVWGRKNDDLLLKYGNTPMWQLARGFHSLNNAIKSAGIQVFSYASAFSEMVANERKRERLVNDIAVMTGDRNLAEQLGEEKPLEQLFNIASDISSGNLCLHPGGILLSSDQQKMNQ